MAPHDIVYTTYVITAMLSKARACYLSRQQNYDALKFNVEAAADREKECQLFTAKEDNMKATIKQQSADLYQAMQDAQENTIELERITAAFDR